LSWVRDVNEEHDKLWHAVSQEGTPVRPPKREQPELVPPKKPAAAAAAAAAAKEEASAIMEAAAPVAVPQSSARERPRLMSVEQQVEMFLQQQQQEEQQNKQPLKKNQQQPMTLTSMSRENTTVEPQERPPGHDSTPAEVTATTPCKDEARNRAASAAAVAAAVAATAAVAAETAAWAEAAATETAQDSSAREVSQLGSKQQRPDRPVQKGSKQQRPLWLLQQQKQQQQEPEWGIPSEPDSEAPVHTSHLYMPTQEQGSAPPTRHGPTDAISTTAANVATNFRDAAVPVPVCKATDGWVRAQQAREEVSPGNRGMSGFSISLRHSRHSSGPQNSTEVFNV